MIIDLILERRDGAPYTKQTIAQILEYCDVFGFADISRAIDAKDEIALKNALYAYIDGEYNPDIKAYVSSVSWLDTHAPTIAEKMTALEKEYGWLWWAAAWNENDQDKKRTEERMEKINDEYVELARQNPLVVAKVRKFYKYDPGFLGEDLRALIKPYRENGEKLIDHPTIILPMCLSKDNCAHCILVNP